MVARHGRRAIPCQQDGSQLGKDHTMPTQWWLLAREERPHHASRMMVSQGRRLPMPTITEERSSAKHLPTTRTKINGQTHRDHMTQNERPISDFGLFWYPQDQSGQAKIKREWPAGGSRELELYRAHKAIKLPQGKSQQQQNCQGISTDLENGVP